MNRLTFQTNNGEMLVMYQLDDDCAVMVNHWNENGEAEKLPTISAPDFVMLYNYYRYIKENDIYHDFINPNGKEVE